MTEKLHVISGIVPGSIAEELEIEAGDILCEMNGSVIDDIFDYQFHMENEYLEILIRKKDTEEEWLLEVEKDEDEDLGLQFASGLMDEYRSCRNKCVFCFIDQMPPGMRETLYFKDDDARLSFLQGNYVTLTNMSDHDIERIIHYHLGPINISFHTTNPELRCRMLHNRFAGEALQKAARLAEAGVPLNGQIVLCRGLNDGVELDRTIRDLASYQPALGSVSVVPVGLTDYRDGLYPLEPFDEADAKQVLEQIHTWQKRYLQQYGTRLIHASDEWYLLAGAELPDADSYEGYPQLENGVGMLRLLEEEVSSALQERQGNGQSVPDRAVLIATGMLAASVLEKLSGQIMDQYPMLHISVLPVRNDFFGNRITVSGLITGRDLIRQIQECAAAKPPCEVVLIPCNMLRSGETVFLDDITVEEVTRAAGIPVIPVDADGEALVSALLAETYKPLKRRQQYEQTDCSSDRASECRKINTV
ncbi:MAG: DUF512 domain-containing protein [Eubacterium sp.]|nr:DUF512 domain-containing protein [Eubacterium sp.]